MARPQKFRLSPDDVLAPQNAKKLAGHVSEIEFFRAEVEKLQAQIAGIYDAADDEGFDKKFVRKTVARRAKDGAELDAEEYAIDAYATAVEKGLATRTREGNAKAVPPHDAETGEILEDVLAPEPNVSAALSAERAAEVITQSPPETTPPDREADHPSGEGDHATGASAASVALIHEYPRGESGTAREASGGSAPSDGIAGLKQGTESAPRTNEGAAATETAPDYLREPPAVVTGQIIREGDAPLEPSRHARATGEAFTSEHPDTNSPETATKSTAARLDVQVVQGLGCAKATLDDRAPAGTRAPPVDTQSPETANETGAADVPTADPQGSEAATHEAAATAAPAPAPLIIAPRQIQHNSDPRCLDKAKCGPMSNYAFCMKCRAAFQERQRADGKAA